MNKVAERFWERAKEAALAAKHVLPVSANAAASRAYYSAFYAVSALFALEGKTFKKHSAIERAVHRDLVRPGLWPKKLGGDYSVLVELRDTSDYGVLKSVSPDEAASAIQLSENILRAVAEAHPQEFTGLAEIQPT